MRPYCLYCFTRLEPDTIDCDTCGRKSLKSDRRFYWNRCPTFVRAQRAIMVLSIVPVGLLVLLCIRSGTGPGGGWLIALPICMYVGVSQTAAKLTKHAPYFRPSIFWPFLFVAAGILLGLTLSPFCIFLGFLSGFALQACESAEAWKQQLRNGKRPSQ